MSTSNLAMTQAEEKNIDSKVEQMMDWAQSRQIEAEQLALDSARLMACTTDRLDRLSKQGFFKRCWSRFNGDANAMERANVNDVIQMQKMAFRYVNMLQEQHLLMAHSLLSLKNNLNSLAVREEETRNLIAMLAQRTLERFEQLEGRVGKLETSSSLHDWLFTLEERDYEEKIPTDYMRLLRVINDFYDIKNDNWNNNDLMFMRKAIRTVGLNPKEKLSINAFIDKLADEIQSNEVGFDVYDKAVTRFAPDNMENYSQFAIENVSSPVFASLHGLNTQYRDKMDAVEALQDSLSISTSDALKTLLRQSIKAMNVNLDYEFPLAETAIEILGCIRLSKNLAFAERLRDRPEKEGADKSINGSSAHQQSKTMEEKMTHIQEMDCDTLMEKMVDISSRICFDAFPIDKRCSCFKTTNGVAGSLPKDYNEILKNCKAKYPVYKIFNWIDSGNDGFFFIEEDSDIAGFGVFDRDENSFGYIKFSDIPENKNEESEEKFGKIMESMIPKLQEKLFTIFPEMKVAVEKPSNPFLDYLKESGYDL